MAISIRLVFSYIYGVAIRQPVDFTFRKQVEKSTVRLVTGIVEGWGNCCIDIGSLAGVVVIRLSLRFSVASVIYRFFILLVHLMYRYFMRTAVMYLLDSLLPWLLSIKSLLQFLVIFCDISQTHVSQN